MHAVHSDELSIISGPVASPTQLSVYSLLFGTDTRLQKIIRDTSVTIRWFLLLAGAWRRVELEEGILQVLVDFHDSSLVAAAIAIVGCTEDCDYMFLVTPVVALHHQLMCTRHQREAVVVVELLGNILPKSVSSSSR